jgi:hypothetical protein
MIRAALGPAGEDGPDVAERLSALEKRVDKLADEIDRSRDL